MTTKTMTHLEKADVFADLAEEFATERNFEVAFSFERKRALAVAKHWRDAFSAMCAERNRTEEALAACRRALADAEHSRDYQYERALRAEHELDDCRGVLRITEIELQEMQREMLEQERAKREAQGALEISQKALNNVCCDLRVEREHLATAEAELDASRRAHKAERENARWLTRELQYARAAVEEMPRH